MKILSRVCAEFKDKKGNVIYRIGPADRLVYKDDAPDAIKDDLLFGALVAEGSIDVVETAAGKKAAEQDPTAGALADGRRIAAPSGGNSGDPEVTRNERAVRGTVATIEGAERKIAKAKTDKAEEKTAEGKPVEEPKK